MAQTHRQSLERSRLEVSVFSAGLQAVIFSRGRTQIKDQPERILSTQSKHSVSIQHSPLNLYQRHIEQGELHPDVAQYQAIKQLDQLFHTLTSKPGKRFQRLFKPTQAGAQGYYLWGGVGTGKTVLMDMFYLSLPAGLGERIHFHRFMQHIHEHKHEIKDQREPLGIIAAAFAARIKVLCLDEFSVTDITDAMILSGLLEHLFNRGVVLVTTSNTEIADLYKDGLQRQLFLPAITLLKKHTIAVHVDSGYDYRMAYLREDAIFHTPVGQQADVELANCFKRLTAQKAHDTVNAYAQTQTNSIVIFGREIAIVAGASGVVWFQFQMLCQTNRSKADYIEIAKQFHTVLLSNIPQLTVTEDDAARRFIELVDELYDRNVNLIVSSAHPPEHIYTGKRLAEPFKRTSSRLIEMSAHAYLAKPHLS